LLSSNHVEDPDLTPVVLLYLCLNRRVLLKVGVGLCLEDAEELFPGVGELGYELNPCVDKLRDLYLGGSEAFAVVALDATLLAALFACLLAHRPNCTGALRHRWGICRESEAQGPNAACQARAGNEKAGARKGRLAQRHGRAAPGVGDGRCPESSHAEERCERPAPPVGGRRRRHRERRKEGEG
jgi:hypothetical protein